RKIVATLIAFMILSGFTLASVASAPVETAWTTKITARFATVEEGRRLMRNRTLFHDQITESILPFFLQKKDGTLEEYIGYSEEQVMDFTPEEKQRLNDALTWLQEQLEKHGLKLPDPGEITFVKSTGQEAIGSAGYTSEGSVFLAWFVLSSEYYSDDMFRTTVIHELSHCFSRMFPKYRKAL
ncbi:MAG: hypothetical protein IJ088_04875, partial [Clostridia bacterium]|nr:hypothetical protein [Clostridia bacterium]